MEAFLAAIANMWERFIPWTTVMPWDAGVRVRFGKRQWTKLVRGGFHLKIPFADEFYTMNIQRQVLDFPNQVVQTTDNKAMCVSGWCVYTISDPMKVWLDVQDHDDALSAKGMDLLAEYLNEMESADCDRESLIHHCGTALNIYATGWGCDIIEFGITDLAPAKVFRLISQDTPLTV